MRGDRRPTWRRLLLLLAVGAVGAAIIVAVARVANFHVAPAPAVVMGMLVGAIVWVAGWFEIPSATPPWQRPQPPAQLARLAADARTRRLISMLLHARPGEGFEASTLSRMLGEFAAARLVRRHGLPVDDPLAHADGHLTPPLLAYLRSEHPPTLKRPTLHAYLKEIDEL